MEIGYDTVLYTLIAIIGLPLIFLRPASILYLLIIMTMFPWYFSKPFTFGYVNVFQLDLIMVLFCLFAGTIITFRFISKKTIIQVPSESKPLLLLIILYIVMHLLYMIAALFQGIPLDSCIRRFLGFADFFYFFLPLLFIRKNNQLKNILIFVVILVVLFPGYQLYRFASSTNLSSHITSSGTIRISSSGLPIIACGLFIILLWKANIQYYLLSVCPMVSILVSGHRSAYLAAAFSLMSFFYFNKKPTKLIMFLYITGFALITALIGLEFFTGHSFYDDALKRSADTFNVENKTTISRIYPIKDNLYVFQKKPIFGIGYNWEKLPGLFMRPDYKKRNVGDASDLGGEFNVIAPHNFILRLLSNTGLVGTSIVLTIIILVMRRCSSLIKADGQIRNTGVLLLSSIIFFLVYSLMNTTFFGEGQAFWILCGLAALIDKNKFQPASEILT